MENIQIALLSPDLKFYACRKLRTLQSSTWSHSEMPELYECIHFGLWPLTPATVQSVCTSAPMMQRN